MTYIGNGDEQAPALGAADLGGLAVHGIIEIARIFAIDGDQRHVSQVDAVLFVQWSHLVGQCSGLRQAGFRKFVRHAVFAYRNLDFHAGVVDLAQHFGDAAHRLAVERRRLGQFDHHHLSRLGIAQSAFGNNRLYTGLPWLPDLGLYDNRQRLYNPAAGRFLTQDPVHDPANLGNPYTYVGNNPGAYVDPYGDVLETVWDGFSLGLGTASLGYNLTQGNYLSAGMDAVGVTLKVRGGPARFLLVKPRLDFLQELRKTVESL